MPLIQTFDTYGDTFPPVLARAEGLKSPQYVEIDTSFYPVQKIFAPGFFAGTTATVDRYRLLPRTKVVSITGAVITVTAFTAAVFRAGDVITQINLADGTAGTAVGTVSSVDHAANTVTLTAAPGTAPGVGVVIGVATSRPVKASGDRLGLLTPNTVLDLSMRPNSQFGVFLSATVYRNRLPHIDAELERLYPELNFV